MEKLRVMVVDDSALYRKILTDILSKFSMIEVVASANSGKVALEKLSKEDIDFITLDFEMPGMNGVEVLTKMKELHPGVSAVMVSSHTQEGATTTLKALEAGAFDFVAKPNKASMAESIESLKEQLSSVIRSLQATKRVRSTKIVRSSGVPIRKTTAGVAAKSGSLRTTSRVEVVGVAISTGGPNALAKVIPALPANLRVAILIVQHMPAMFTKALADSLNAKSKVTVVEANDGDVIKAATVYIAPGGKQMKVVQGPRGKMIAITDDAPENNCKPAADYMLRSLAKEYKAGALGVIMTGMGADGVKSLVLMRKFGSKVICQDESSCVVYGMPMEAVKAGAVDIQLPLDDICSEIVRAVG